MSLPEISRRCLTCGAAARAGARFCQQCGKAVGNENSNAVVPTAEGVGPSNGDDASGAGGANESSAPTTRDAEAPREWVAPTREFSAFVEELEFEKPHEGAAASDASDGKAADARTPEALTPDATFDPAKTTPITRPVETVGMNSAAGAAMDSSAAAEDGRSRAARVREGARMRAERIRDEARVVLEEKPDDGGLWFIVVAVVLFLIFLFFLFLSTTILR